MNKPKICVIIPTYNENNNIGKLIKLICQLTDYRDSSILIIDDGSSDGTCQTASRIKTKYNLHFVERLSKQGLGSALMEGLKTALTTGSYDFFITMDADLSHDPRDIPRLVNACRDFDVSLGSRYVSGGNIQGIGLLRRFVSLVGNTVTSFSLGLNVADCTSGFKCYRSNVVKSLIPELSSNGYDIQIESLYLALKSGFRIVEVPITFRKRIRGRSKITYLDVLRCINLVKKCSISRLF